ncbi:MAG: oxygen-independent coproporphyrinogen III oxidase [Pseudomonadota bacterium]
MDRLTQLSRMGLFNARVPRYTSYPTAPQFSDRIGDRSQAAWISAIPARSEISFYVHIPFCRRLCWFCACRTQGTKTGAPVPGYLDTLKQELDLIRAHMAEGVTLSRLHWGGGTPTILTPDQIGWLTRAILDVVPLSDHAEFSVEVDPAEIDDARLDALAEAGMTRASIGIQDFDPTIQATIGRDQPFDLTRDVVAALRARGIDSLNADMVYGLPHQTRARLTESVQKLLSLSPDRIALYGYAHVPWMARRQQMIPTDSLPRPEDRLALFETAQRLFTWDGYTQVGIDHFARPADGLARALKERRLRRNFQGYTDDTADVLLGIGASSISRFPQGYSQNATGTSEYAKALQDGRFATLRGHAFQGEDMLRAHIIERIMCDFAVNFAALARECGVTEEDLSARFSAVEAEFRPVVLVDRTGFRIKPEGQPLARVIASRFDAYAAARHSAAF